MQLTGKVALVTGGSRGIGRGIVLALAREGAKVAFVYRGNKEAAESLVAEATQAGGTCQAIQADVAQTEAAQSVVEKVLADYGRVDILVNNAGVIRDGLFIRMERADWNTVIDTNLGGTFNFCKAVSAQMALKQRSGRIINISSVAADHVNAGQCNYSASKGAVNSFTRALAVELAGRSVTVNAIAPGFIESEMTQRLGDAILDEVKKRIPKEELAKSMPVRHDLSKMPA